jgi:hypothetical protein
LDLTDIYLLNLTFTVAMFVVMTVSDWIEGRHYGLMWKELEWANTGNIAKRILIAEKKLFLQIDGGEELYRLLCNLFSTSGISRPINI